MYISGDTYKGLNELLALTFQENAFADNCAYWLEYNSLVCATSIFHEKYAHQFPKWADEISDIMSRMSAKPIRIGLNTENKEYSNVCQLFTEVKKHLDVYREKIYEVIDIAEEDNDREIVNFLDDYLIKLSLYLKQVNIWMEKAKQYEGALEKFDKDFNKFLII